MIDVCVTVPKWFWKDWVAEGDAADDPWTGQSWEFTVPSLPEIVPGERVYVVAHGKLRGYAPLVATGPADGEATSRASGRWARFCLVRQGGAVAITIPALIPGFRGFRYRWWAREIEVPFPSWKIP